MKYAVALVVLGACSFHGTGHLDDDPIDASPIEHDAPPIADAPADARDAMVTPGDTDGDGILDGIDNCPAVANPMQENEDFDLTGDACDLCPHIAAVDTDGDNDGVGDMCDPRPGIAGDHIAYWNGFNTAGPLPAGMVPVGGTGLAWGVAGGVLSTSTNNTAEIIRIDAGSPNHTIDFTASQVDNVTSMMPSRAVSVLTDLAVNASSYVLCGARPQYATREMWDWGESSPGAWLQHVDDQSEAVPSGTYHVISRIAPGIVRCFVPSPTALHQLDASVATKNNNYVGIRNRSLAISIAYVIVYAY